MFVYWDKFLYIPSNIWDILIPKSYSSCVWNSNVTRATVFYLAALVGMDPRAVRTLGTGRKESCIHCLADYVKLRETTYGARAGGRYGRGLGDAESESAASTLSEGP